MKKLLTISAAVLCAAASSTICFAQDVEDDIITPKSSKDWFVYGDANLALMQFSTTEGNSEFVSDSLTASFFRAGAKYKYFGAEVELGSGLSDIDEDGVSVGVKSQTSVFGIIRLPSDDFDIYLRLGYHSSDLDVAVEGLGEDTFTEKGFAGGIGGTYFFSENFGVRADITNYQLKDTLDVNYIGGSLGGVVRF